MKKILANLVKLGLALAIIGWLVYNAAQKKEFGEVLRAPKDWGLIAAAFALLFAGVCLSFVRWHRLVRTLDFPFTLKDAFRLSFLGYLFNFVGPGGVGGDLVKAVFIAHENKDRRAQAVATVIIDRIVGLYALFVVASGAILLSRLWASPVQLVRIVANGTLIGTVAGAVGILMLLIPGFTSGRFSRRLSDLPKVGRTFQQLLEAVRMYRSRLGSVAFALLLSMLTHVLSVTSFYLLGCAIPGTNPTLSEHFVILPLAMVAGAIPITPAGMGTMEAVIEYLFPIMSAGEVAGSRGLVISLLFRLMTIFIALIGAGVYFWFHREMAAIVHEAETQAEKE